MSNLYLLDQMILPTETFSRRIRRLYDAWMIPEPSTEDDTLSNVDCFVVLVGDDYSKSISFHKWLFGYELNNTICVFTRDIVHILVNKKGAEFLKRTENHMEPKIQLLIRDRSNNDCKNFTKLLDLAKLARNGKKIGIFSTNGLTGRFFESWQMEMGAYNFETVDIDSSIAYIMAVKDESELASIRKGCLVSTEIFQSYLKPRILEIINNMEDVKHSQLAKGVQFALNKKKFCPMM